MFRIKNLLLLVVSKFVRLLRGEISTERLIRNGLKVGHTFRRQGGCRIDSSYCFLIEIGNNVSLSTNVIILAHDGSSRYPCSSVRVGKVVIGDNVFIGAGTIVLPGVTIGDDVVIGSGSVVTKDIPSGTVCAGNPCRFIRTLDSYKESLSHKMETGPIFDKRFNPLAMSKAEKEEMKSRLDKGIGYYLSDEYYKS